MHDLVDAERLKPEGQAWYKVTPIPSLSSHGLPSACNSILTYLDSDDTA